MYKIGFYLLYFTWVDFTYNILLAFQVDCGEVLTEENKLLDFIPQRPTKKIAEKGRNL